MKTTLTESHVIRFEQALYAKPNTSVAQRWQGIKSGMTVAEALKKGARRGDIHFALAHERLRLEAPKAKAAASAPAARKKAAPKARSRK